MLDVIYRIKRGSALSGGFPVCKGQKLPQQTRLLCSGLEFMVHIRLATYVRLRATVSDIGQNTMQ